MNGTKALKIQSMTDGEFRVLLVEKMNNFDKAQKECKQDLNDNKEKLDKLALAVARIPPHCVQIDTLKEYDKRIDELEKKDAASKAVKSLLIGLVGGVGGSGGLLAVLKWVFNVFP